MKWIIAGYLMLLSIEDILKKTLPVWQIAAGMVLAVGIGIWNGMKEPAATLLLLPGCIPGIVFLGAAKVSRQQVGYGDGLLLLPLGLLMGFEKTMVMVLWALLLAAAAALGMVVLFRRRLGMELPFVPFLLAGYVITGGV